MSDYIKQVTIDAQLLNVTYDEWDYIKDALGSLATMGVLTKLNIQLERASTPENSE